MIGTFLPTVATLISPPNLTFVMVGTTLLVMALAIGKISGSHINSAVTFGLIAARQFPARARLAYIVAQLVGAFLALGLGQLLDHSLPHTDPAVDVLWFEMLGTALFVFVVTRVVIGKLPEAATALEVSVALLIAIAISAPSSGGVLNPAISSVLLTDDLIQRQPVELLTYLIGPLVAAPLSDLLAR